MNRADLLRLTPSLVIAGCAGSNPILLSRSSNQSLWKCENIVQWFPAQGILEFANTCPEPYGTEWGQAQVIQLNPKVGWPVKIDMWNGVLDGYKVIDVKHGAVVIDSQQDPRWTKGRVQKIFDNYFHCGHNGGTIRNKAGNALAGVQFNTVKGTYTAFGPNGFKAQGRWRKQRGEDGPATCASATLNFVACLLGWCILAAAALIDWPLLAVATIALGSAYLDMEAQCQY